MSMVRTPYVEDIFWLSELAQKNSLVQGPQLVVAKAALVVFRVETIKIYVEITAPCSFSCSQVLARQGFFYLAGAETSR